MEALKGISQGNTERKGIETTATSRGTVPAPAARAAEAAEVTPEEHLGAFQVGADTETRQGEEFGKKNTNIGLAEGWAALVGGPSLQEIIAAQGGNIPEAQAPVEEQALRDTEPGEVKTGNTAAAEQTAAPSSAGSSRKFPLNVEDNAENRALKAEYNQANIDLEEARNYSKFTGSGQRTSCFDEGAGLSYERSEDGRLTVDNNHKSMYVDRPEYDKLEYSIDDTGNLTKTMTDAKGARSYTALAEGGFVEKDGNGEIIRTVPADKGMRDYDKIASEWGSSFDRDGKKSPLTDEQKYTMTTALSGFDKETLENLRNSGVKLEAWDFKASRLPGDEQGSSAAGYYGVDENTVVVNQNKFEGGVSTKAAHVIRHELGHAIDDRLLPSQKGLPAAEEDPIFLSKTDKKVENFLGDYQQRSMKNDDNFWTSYGKQDVREYMAEGVSAFTAQGEEKDKFRKADPEFYSYIEQKMKAAREPMAQ